MVIFWTILPPFTRTMSLKIIKTQLYICLLNLWKKSKILNTGFLCYINLPKTPYFLLEMAILGADFDPFLSVCDHAILSEFGKMSHIGIYHNIWRNWRKRTRQFFFIPFFRKKWLFLSIFYIKLAQNTKWPPNSKRNWIPPIFFKNEFIQVT